MNDKAYYFQHKRTAFGIHSKGINNKNKISPPHTTHTHTRTNTHMHTYAYTRAIHMQTHTHAL